MNTWKYFELAKKAAKLIVPDKRDHLIGAVGLRNDGVIVCSCNGSAIIATDDRRHYAPKVHAESRLSRKLDKGSVVFVIRITRGNGQFANSKPCETCQSTLRKRGVKRVYYTISNNSYGVISFRK